MDILGISCFYHDAAAALVRDGMLVAAAEEERFTRRKHDARFPEEAIRFCLEAGGVEGRALDLVVFYEKPFLKFERLLMSILATVPRSYRLFREAMGPWLLDKLWVKALIRERLGVPPGRILFSEHHLSHAASAFYCSPFDEAAILTVDGVGEWATASSGVGRGTEINLTSELRFPHSVGLLYSTFTAFLGFEVNEGEYKVMGMAPYGTPRHLDKVWRLLHVDADGGIRLNTEYFAFHHSRDRAFSDRFLRLFGAPREPGSYFFTEATGFPSYFGARPDNFERQARANQHYADVAASIQAVTEEILLRMVRRLHRETGLPNLCMAGGVALNSVANGRILREGPFERLYIHPAAGDGGGAVGAAFYAYHAVHGKPRTFVMEHAYWGKEYGPEETARFLGAQGIAYECFEEEEKLLDRVVDLLQGGKVVGWHQGRFEWGPRALGNRSILADPRRAEMKDIVNVKIKFREPYRPFAPAILADRTEEFFDLPGGPIHLPASFMLLVADVWPEKRAVVPATTHVDGSGRLQTVSREISPRYYRLIQRFGEATGVPVLLNTSFNLKGEPIVASPADALATFCRSGLDALVLGDFLVVKGDRT